MRYWDYLSTNNFGPTDSIEISCFMTHFELSVTILPILKQKPELLISLGSKNESLKEGIQKKIQSFL
jgi:hypothetical protein